MVLATKSRDLMGDETEAFGADPSELDKTYKFRYRVLELDDVVASHTDTLAINPNYPQELQPRLRDRAASKIQIDNMAKNLNPHALLHDSGFIDTGPMIIGPDRVVEGGNGRVLAMRKAYQDYPDRYKMYQDMLLKNAVHYGLDIDDIAQLKKPILVRERLSHVDRVAFATETNVGKVMTMSPYEQALQDANHLSDNVISTLRVGKDQTIDQALRSSANTHIVRHFATTIPPTELAVISDEKGGINQQGLQRLKLAIFTKTYRGEAGKRLVRIFGENIDPIIKSIENSMFQSLPDMAKAQSLIDAGHRDKSLSIGVDLAKVIDTYASLKQSEISIKDYLAQKAMFEERLNPFQQRILAHLDDISHRPKLVREFLRGVANRIEAAPPPEQVGMLGAKRLTKEVIIDGTITKQRQEEGMSSLEITPIKTADKGLEKPDTKRARGIEEVAEGVGARTEPDTEEIVKPEVKPREMPEPSIIKDWVKLRDWEVRELAKKGYEKAIKEMKRRGLSAEKLPKGYKINKVAGVYDIYRPDGKLAGTRRTEEAAIKYAQDYEVEFKLTAPRARIKKKVKTAKIPSVAELRRIHHRRSYQSRVMDEALQHSQVVKPTSPKVIHWTKVGGSMDIEGIDTLRKPQKVEQRTKIQRKTKPPPPEELLYR